MRRAPAKGAASRARNAGTMPRLRAVRLARSSFCPTPAPVLTRTPKGAHDDQDDDDAYVRDATAPDASNPQSQSLSRSYGSILPTSLTIHSSTRREAAHPGDLMRLSVRASEIRSDRPDFHGTPFMRRTGSARSSPRVQGIYESPRARWRAAGRFSSQRTSAVDGRAFPRACVSRVAQKRHLFPA